MTGVPPLRVQHVRRVASERTPSLLRPQSHVINVAFNNRVGASEKRIDGGRVCRLAGRTVGRSLVMPVGSEWWGWSVGEFDFLRIELHPGALRAAGEEAGRTGAVDLRPQVQLDDPVLWHLACVLRADLAMGCPGGHVLRDGVQGLIAHHLAAVRPAGASHPEPPPGPLSPARLRTVREFVRANLHRELRLSEVAGTVGMSTFHFARAFRATVGVPPYRYVLEERLVAARRLLEGTDLSVGEVARLAGFQTLTGFGASFRRRWGVPPSQYRRSIGA
jgi:AraC family transcriptional regulator